MGDKRVTYRRKHSYNSKSNGVRIVKTPGGNLHTKTRYKRVSGAKCGDCKVCNAFNPKPEQQKRV